MEANTRILLLALFCFSCLGQEHPHVLFIAVDDLRPQLKTYGFEWMHTPNIDALAKSGVQFRFAFVQQAVCSPSRTSLLTGRRPDTTHVYNLWHYFRHMGCNVTTLPQFFKDKGYQTSGQGKIFHPGHASDHDDPPSWTTPYYHSPNLGKYSTRKHSWLTPNHPEMDFPDAQVATHAIEEIKKAKQEGRQFFIAAGFHKPHLPFVFPKPYLDFYPNNTIHIADDPYPPQGMPKIAWSDFGELRNYDDIKALGNKCPKGIGKDVPDWKARDLRRAYYGATSFTDVQVGRLMKTLKDEGLDNNTIVVFWGDHGWQLGEHGEWCKHTNFELAARAPLILRAPKYSHLAGTVIDSLVEHVDIYPTLVDLTGFGPPNPNLQGFSMVPLLENPGHDWGRVALSQYPRHDSPGPPGTRDDGNPHAMGYSIRTHDWRYTEWVYYNNNTWTMDWTKVFGRELYDHRGDDGTSFHKWENKNVVDHKDHQHLVHQLSEKLHMLFDQYKRNATTQCKN